MDNEDQIKLVVDSLTGRVFAKFYDGSWLPVKADKNGIVYVELEETE